MEIMEPSMELLGALMHLAQYANNCTATDDIVVTVNPFQPST